jgi:hypothetical protein
LGHCAAARVRKAMRQIMGDNKNAAATCSSH